MAAEMSVWERHRAQLQCQQQQQQKQSYFNDYINSNIYPINHPLSLSQSQNLLLPTTSLPGNLAGKQCPELASLGSDEWPDLAHYPMLRNSCFNQVNYLPRTSSCPTEVKGRHLSGSGIGNESSRSNLMKRKAEADQIPKQETDPVAIEDSDIKSKRIKADAALQLKEDIINNNDKRTETSGTTTKENSKLSEERKTDYIHVRARRGQATDNHSLAERVRREKISERMRYLQDLVPGCNKTTGKAGMLDEIINYVQALQRQVEFLSMKLAAVNPKIDFNIDNFHDREIIPVCNGASVSAFGVSTEFGEESYIPYDRLVDGCGLDLSLNSLDKSFFNVHQPSPVWDTDLLSICNVELNPAGRASTFPFQSLSGTLEDNDFKETM